MYNEQFEKYNSIPKEKFEFAKGTDKLHDQKFDTKPVSYMRDAFNRFKKNKSSLAAAIIILILLLFAIIVPFCADKDYVEAYSTETVLKRYKELKPRLRIFDGTGFWDGSQKESLTEVNMWRLRGIAQETGYDPIQREIRTYEVSVPDANGESQAKKMYEVRVNQYYALGVDVQTLTSNQYEEIQAWQDENHIQVILPWVNEKDSHGRENIIITKGKRYEYWFVCDSKGDPKLDEQGNLIPNYKTTSSYSDGTRRDGYHSLQLENDPGNWAYSQKVGGAEGKNSYKVRLNMYNYFIYKFGHAPAFVFGTDSNGYDIVTRLAGGARFSFMLAILVSAINLTVGAIYGAIAGYYGGVTDLVMERITDILSGIPFMVVTVLFNLHLAAKVGVVGALIYAFVLTGWIGMASTVRMQFYRFKNQEYVLAARTLGAKDWRIIWKHIFPNTLGTIITGCVLVIPSVIFSETSLSYLGIINLDSPTMSSIGSMLSAGQSVMTSAPHVVFFPALFIALLEISFNLFGNGLRDAFNPSLRGVEE